MSLHLGDRLRGEEAFAASEVVLEVGNAKVTYCMATSTVGSKSSLLLEHSERCVTQVHGKFILYLHVPWLLAHVTGW
jgi:hypothetical protein